MAFGIERHRPCPLLGRHSFRHGELVGRLFPNHRQVSIVTRREGEFGLSIVGGRVHTIANWKGAHFPASVGIHNGHQLVTTGKQPAMLAIDRQSTRLFAACHRPTCLYLELIGIERLNLVLVLDIDEYSALLIAHPEFRLAIEFDGSDHFALFGVEHARIMATPVKSEHVFACRVIQDRVRILADFDFA